MRNPDPSSRSRLTGWRALSSSSLPWQVEEKDTELVTVLVTAVTDPVTASQLWNHFWICKWTPFFFFIFFVVKIDPCVYYNFCVLHFSKIVRLGGEKWKKMSLCSSTPESTCFLHNFFILNRNWVIQKPKS